MSIESSRLNARKDTRHLPNRSSLCPELFGNFNFVTFNRINKMKTKNRIALVSFALILSLPALAQKKVLTPDLSVVKNAEKWTAVNREVSFDGQVHLNAKARDGLLVLNGIEFENGTIELDIRGKDVFQQSFVGVAFHGVNDSTFDAIYFRPFNFKNPQRSTHSVQYISMPGFDWNKLRSEFPGKYENIASPVPDPNDLFHAKVVVNYPEIKVFVSNFANPSLVVKQISSQQKGWIGFWVGNGSDGDFKNLKITFE